MKVDIERTLADIVKLSKTGLNSDSDNVSPTGYLAIHPDCQYRRLAATVDLQLAANILTAGAGDDTEHQPVESIQSQLLMLNAVVETAVRQHLNTAVSNIVHSVWQRFINVDGERAPAVTSSQALMNRYCILVITREYGIVISNAVQ